MDMARPVSSHEERLYTSASAAGEMINRMGKRNNFSAF